MREVDLRMEENHTYQIIKKLVVTEGNKNSAALKLGCTKRHIQLKAGLRRTYYVSTLRQRQKKLCSLKYLQRQESRGQNGNIGAVHFLERY